MLVLSHFMPDILAATPHIIWVICKCHKAVERTSGYSIKEMTNLPNLLTLLNYHMMNILGPSLNFDLKMKHRKLN
jgi:hypothetical protein